MQFNTVTWHSKLLAAIVLFGAFPALVFYIGIQYQKTEDVLQYKVPPVAERDPYAKYIVYRNESGDGTDASSTEACIDEDGNAVDLDTASQMDLTYCAWRAVDLAEKSMKTTYDAVLVTASTSEYTKNLKQSVVDAQKLWISYKDSHCNAEGLAYEGGSIQPMIVGDCKARLTKDRSVALQELLTSISPQ